MACTSLEEILFQSRPDSGECVGVEGIAGLKSEAEEPSFSSYKQKEKKSKSLILRTLCFSNFKILFLCPFFKGGLITEKK